MEKITSQRDILLKKGIQIDLEEGWKKIISRQFGGNPGKGFGELIQNFLDSYDESIPWRQRRGIIYWGPDWISLKDFGSGLDIKKVELATQMGGTDKNNDPSKIGKFGIGLFSIFNPKLDTKMVEITTRCEGQSIKLDYIVNKHGQRPDLKYTILNHPIDFSTEVKVTFGSHDSVKKCLEYGQQSLRYYPCDISLNGKKFHSIWDLALMSDAFYFEKKYSNGFIKPGNRYRSTTVLCNYEYIIELPVRYLVTGGHNVHSDLRDYCSKETPYLPGMEAVINCNNLTLTISRDSYYLNYNFDNMISDLNSSLSEVMNMQFNHLSEKVVLANIYILRRKIGEYLKNRSGGNEHSNPENDLFEKIVTSRIFKINGKKGSYSIVELKKELSENIPLFFSETKTNLRWLGGEFKHDFILLVEPCTIENGAPDFYVSILTSLFGDVINLDTISSDVHQIRKLIDRGIIRKETVDPACTFLEVHQLTKEEKHILGKLHPLLNKRSIIDVVEKNIGIPVSRIEPVFFKLKNEAVHISTGIFDPFHKPINDDFISNFLISKNDHGVEKALNQKNTILLGLCLNHPFIRKMVSSNDPQREYYALTYIAHELTTCQKMLSPYSTFYNMVKANLSSQLRQCMIEEIVKNI